MNDIEIIESIHAGGVGVLRTDTLYGIVAHANNESAVKRIYALKHRDDTKSPIVLISSIDHLFDNAEAYKPVLTKYWPGRVSIILPSVNAPDWISRGNNSVAYRLPDDLHLQKLIHATGPLIAPSANPQGKKPATSIKEAIEYFGDSVDFYVDDGSTSNALPSMLIRVHEDGREQVLR